MYHIEKVLRERPVNSWKSLMKKFISVELEEMVTSWRHFQRDLSMDFDAQLGALGIGNILTGLCNLYLAHKSFSSWRRASWTSLSAERTTLLWIVLTSPWSVFVGKCLHICAWNSGVGKAAFVLMTPSNNFLVCHNQIWSSNLWKVHLPVWSPSSRFS